MSGKKPFSAAGQVWLSRDGENVLNESRIALLEKIAETGSITKAGKAVGISYRTAWLTVDHLNDIADRPLVERTAGGKSGGGTRLTGHGEDLLKVYRAIEEEHRKYLERLREGIHDFDRFLRLTRKISLKTSARNQLFGVVESIREEGLTAEVMLRLKGRDRIRSQITVDGLEGLGLREGEDAYALIKANWISLASGRGKAGGPGNRLPGKVISLRKARSNAEVVTQLRGGSRLVARVSLQSAEDAGLKEGKTVFAGFEPENVILGLAR
ncbi:MAG TPA: TOBE domain-containing protein [Fibrobacteria bacterium]|nr:TOBE domain-containing protein [Fibrobacteria bacterium]